MASLDFAMDLDAGLVTLKKNLITAPGSLSAELFESAKVVNSMSLAAFYRLLKASIGDSYVSPILPFGCVYYEETDAFFSIVMQSNPLAFKFNHRSYTPLQNETAFLPKTYFMFVVPSSSIREGKKLGLSKTYMFVDQDPLNNFDKEKRYKFSPFPNYSHTYGTGICWGGSGDLQFTWSRDFGTLSALESAPAKYVNSQFNNDLNPRFSNSSLQGIIRESFAANSLLPEFVKFLNSVGYMNVSESRIENTTIKDVFDNVESMALYYSYICWWGSVYSTFPLHVLSVLGSYDAPVSSILRSPLRGY